MLILNLAFVEVQPSLVCNLTLLQVEFNWAMVAAHNVG